MRVASCDADGRKSLAGYMLRAPFSLEKMTYDAARGTVIYRSKLHATLNRNFEVMPGVAWQELLCNHVPERHEHMVRYITSLRRVEGAGWLQVASGGGPLREVRHGASRRSRFAHHSKQA